MLNIHKCAWANVYKRGWLATVYIEAASHYITIVVSRRRSYFYFIYVSPKFFTYSWNNSFLITWEKPTMVATLKNRVSYLYVSNNYSVIKTVLILPYLLWLTQLHYLFTYYVYIIWMSLFYIVGKLLHFIVKSKPR